MRIPLDGMRVQSLNDPDMKHGFQIISTCKSFRLEARCVWRGCGLCEECGDGRCGECVPSGGGGVSGEEVPV